MDEKFVTLHPQGKRGVKIAKAKYDVVKEAILTVLKEGSLTHDELTEAVEGALGGKFEGSIPWYMESTKLDLEARKVIERVPGKPYERYRIRKK